MKNPSAANVHSHPHLDHLFKIGELYWRGRSGHYSPSVAAESEAEILRYRDEGLILQQQKEALMGQSMTTSGYCAFESPGSHAACSGVRCTCSCHQERKAFSGQGILFAVIDDREQMRMGKVTTISIIADAIEAALDAGHEDSDAIARYLTTSAFQHIPDKRVRFNSVLKAGDTVGAQIVKKLYNSYNELADMADKSKSAAEKATLKAEAQGFAEAIQIIMSPFSAEDSDDPALVNWDAVDSMTETFEKEQHANRVEKKKNR